MEVSRNFGPENNFKKSERFNKKKNYINIRRMHLRFSGKHLEDFKNIN